MILTPYIIDKSEKLSQLQKELGMLAQIQKDYNLKIFEKLEKKSKTLDDKRDDDLDILKSEESEDF